MGYVTADFYLNVYLGTLIPSDMVQKYLDKASADIDILTRRRIEKFGGFDALSKFEQTQVQMAVCSQAEHLHHKSPFDGVSSYSIGDINVSMAEAPKKYCDGCIAHLNSTQLMYRGL